LIQDDFISFESINHNDYDFIALKTFDSEIEVYFVSISGAKKRFKIKEDMKEF